jgi:hypothetical protein
MHDMIRLFFIAVVGREEISPFRVSIDTLENKTLYSPLLQTIAKVEGVPESISLVREQT